jgi:DNA primase
MEIQQIKNSLEITVVAEQLGIKIDGKSKRALCPFHNDKKPSLQFSKEKQICTCFSSNCNAGTVGVIGLTEKKLQKTKSV